MKPPSLYAHDWRFIWTESPCLVLINQKAQCLSYQLIIFILITGWRVGRLILRRNRPRTAGRLMLIALFAEPGETICLQALPALRLRASDTSNPPNPSCASSYLYQIQSHSDKRHLFKAFIYQRLPRSVMDYEMVVKIFSWNSSQKQRIGHGRCAFVCYLGTSGRLLLHLRKKVLLLLGYV